MPSWSGEGRRIERSVCPRCGAELEYNGNYWCTEKKCSYVMPGEPEYMRKKDKIAFNFAYVLLMQQTGREPEASALYQEVLDQLL